MWVYRDDRRVVKVREKLSFCFHFKILMVPAFDPFRVNHQHDFRFTGRNTLRLRLVFVGWATWFTVAHLFHHLNGGQQKDIAHPTWLPAEASSPPVG